jgi:hypothetical protein
VRERRVHSIETLDRGGFCRTHRTKGFGIQVSGPVVDGGAVMDRLRKERDELR